MIKPEYQSPPTSCGACGSTKLVEVRPGVIQCNDLVQDPAAKQPHHCAWRVAHGHVMPRVVVQPHDDRRFTVLTIGDQQFVLDVGLAKLAGSALESLG